MPKKLYFDSVFSDLVPIKILALVRDCTDTIKYIVEVTSEIELYEEGEVFCTHGRCLVNKVGTHNGRPAVTTADPADYIDVSGESEHEDLWWARYNREKEEKERRERWAEESTDLE